MIETHPTPEAMARVLCSYIACDDRVAREVRVAFLTEMSAQAVKQIRRSRERDEAKTRRGRQAAGYLAKGWDWRGGEYTADMASASDTFLAAIDAARNPSQMESL